MSEFFDWLGNFTPTIIYFVLWVALAPIRFAVMLVLPRNAERRYHALNGVFEFFAFERR